MFNSKYRSLRWSLPLRKIPVPVHWLLSILISTTLIGCDGGKTDIPSPTGNTSTPQEPTSQGPRLVISSITAAPSEDTDCQLPDSPVVDVFGVPNNDWIEAYFLFPQAFGSTKEFGVIAEKSEVAWTSETQTGPHEKVVLTIKKGETRSSGFIIQGKSVDKTDLITDAVVDDRETYDNTQDDVHYPVARVKTVVWDIREEDIVDYNALGLAGETTCHKNDATSPALKDDPNFRINCGVRAKSVAADGTSYQLLRLRAGDYGKACFTVLKDTGSQHGTDPQYLGSFSDPLTGQLGQNPASNVPTTFQFQQEGETVPQHWALGTYIPPSDFFTPDVSERKVEIEVQFVPQNANGQPVRSNVTAKKKLEITIRRPPVLFVHGLWSSECVWKDYLNVAPEKGWRVNTISYDKHPLGKCGAGASASYATDGSIGDLRHKTYEIVEAMHRDRTAVTRIDLVAHSMGGLLSRKLFQENPHNGDDLRNYRSSENFNKGSVRKLITLHTPHLGTQIANLLVHLHSEFPHNHPSIELLELALGSEVHHGAICDLAENARGLNFFTAPDVRGFAFVGRGGDIGSLHPPLFYTPAVLPFWYNSDIAPYIFQVPNDGIVADDSQQGPLLSQGNFSLVHSEQFSGLPVTKHTDTAKAIFQMLDKDASFTTQIGANFSTGDGVPRFGVGQGIDNAADYAVQCANGGPMRQR